MHLNALYRAAQAGKQSLLACVQELSSAGKWASRSLLGLPLMHWHLRHARKHLDDARRELLVVRENVTLVASLGAHVQIDSSGGYAVQDLLAGGLLEALPHIVIDSRVGKRIEEVHGLLADVGELMMRMRKAGAV